MKPLPATHSAVIRTMEGIIAEAKAGRLTPNQMLGEALARLRQIDQARIEEAGAGSVFRWKAAGWEERP